MTSATTTCKRPDGSTIDSFSHAEVDLMDASKWEEQTSEMVLSAVDEDGSRSQLTVVRRGDGVCLIFVDPDNGLPGWISCRGAVFADVQPVESQDVVIWYPGNAFLDLETARGVVRRFVDDRSRSESVEWERLNLSSLTFEELW